MTVRGLHSGFFGVMMLAFGHVLPASADDVFHDYQLAQVIAADCIGNAKVMADAMACMGEATRQSNDPASPWPWKARRDCDWGQSRIGWGETLIWEDIYQTEVMQKLAWGRAFDAGLFSGNGHSDALYTVMTAELAWRRYAYTFCNVSELPDADKSYEFRLANDPPCMSHMYTERFFHLRSLTYLSLENAR